MPASSKTDRRLGAATAPRPARRGSSATDLALIATFAGLIIVLGLVGTLTVFGGAVPITAQTLGVMLAGAILGWKRGVAAVLVVIGLCAAGLPVLAGGRGGLGVFASPTVGYLLGWTLGAAVVGWMVQRRLPQPPLWWLLVACVVGGIGGIYLIGVPGVALRTNVSLVVAAKSAVVFLPGDLIKAVIAAVVAGAVHRASPGVTPRLGRARR